jgi:carbon starvation protein CstA
MRVPRKKKKQAKKLKAANDALVICQAAMVTASSLAQLAIISAVPFELPALRAVKAAQHVVDAQKSVMNVMQGIKPWTFFVPNYRA